MNYTEKYHLPQWKKEDRVMMEDFNEAMVGIEEGMADARERADTAKSEAAEAARLPYVTGHYVGTGKDMSIKLGFCPSFVIISGLKAEGSAVTNSYACFMVMTAGNIVQDRIILTDSGFTAKARVSGRQFPDLVDSGRTYDYIAFR